MKCIMKNTLIALIEVKNMKKLLKIHGNCKRYKFKNYPKDGECGFFGELDPIDDCCGNWVSK